MPYIKSEPDEFDTLSNGYNNFNSNHDFAGFQQTFSGGIDPSELSMGNGSFNQGYNYGGQNMSGSFMTGGSGFINDDELLDGIAPDYTGLQSNGVQGINNNQGQLNGVYSHTPDGAPIQSPFVGGFDYSQFRPMNSIMPQHMSPHQGTSFLNKRPSMQAQGRKSSTEQRHSMTPRTSAMAGLRIGTPESNGIQNGRAIRAPNGSSRHQKTMSGQFDSTPGSGHSLLDSPLSSPSNLAHHAG